MIKMLILFKVIHMFSIILTKFYRYFVVLNPRINIKWKIVKSKKIVKINNMWGTCPIRFQGFLYTATMNNVTNHKTESA